MSIPKYFEMQKPFLEALKDGKEHTLKELKKELQQYFRLTDDELSEILPSGRQSVFANRIGWASTYLKKSGLIQSPARATYTITDEGLRVLQDNPIVIDNEYLLRYESFRAFQSPLLPNAVTEIEQSDNTPDDAFEEAFEKINVKLADEILAEVMKLSDTAFEQLTINLLLKMGYGTFENAGRKTPKTGDEGIDGIIMEDKLGFSLIYIQAKKWSQHCRASLSSELCWCYIWQRWKRIVCDNNPFY